MTEMIGLVQNWPSQFSPVSQVGVDSWHSDTACDGHSKAHLGIFGKISWIGSHDYHRLEMMAGYTLGSLARSLNDYCSDLFSIRLQGY